MSARSVLYNVLSLTGLVVDTPEVVPHKLNINGVGQIPRSLAPDASGFTITADAVNLMVTRTADAADGSVDIFVEIPSTADNLPPLPNTITDRPFIFGGGGGGGASSTQYVFVWQPGATNQGNVYGDWTSLYAAVSAVAGAKIIEIYDPEQNDAVIDVDGTYDLVDVTLMGRVVNGELPAFYTEGAVLITNLRNIGPDLELDTNDQPPFVNESTEENEDGATGPFRLNGVSVFGDWWHYTEEVFAKFTLSSGATFSDNRVIQIDDDSGTDLEFDVLDPTVRIGANTIEVGTGGRLIVKAANLVTFSQDQIGGGTIDFNVTSNPLGTGQPPGLSMVPISTVSGSPLLVALGTLAVADTSGGAFACSLPTLATSRTAQVIIVNTGGNILTVTADAGAGDHINGAATFALAAHSSVTLVAGQSTDWYIAAKG